MPAIRRNRVGIAVSRVNAVLIPVNEGSEGIEGAIARSAKIAAFKQILRGYLLPLRSVRGNANSIRYQCCGGNRPTRP